MILVSKIEHKNQPRILLRYPFNKQVNEKVKALPGATYTNTYKGWCIDYHKESWQAFIATGLNYQIEDSGTTDRARLLRDNAGKTLSDVPSDCTKQAADTPILQIRFSYPYLLITGSLCKHDIDLLKQISKVYWNDRYKNWVVPATVESLSFLSEKFGMPGSEQLSQWQHQIGLLSSPPKCILYSSPEFPNQILMQLKGTGVDVDFIKHLPERAYNLTGKFWLIPSERKIVQRIIDHYTGLKTKVINRIKVESIPDPALSFKERKKYLLDKTPENHRTMIESYLDVMIREHYSWNTLREYHAKFVQFVKSIEPARCDEISEVEVNTYLTQISSNKVSEALINTIINAIKFYYQKVLFRPDFKINRIKRPRKAMQLPKVLSIEEVDRLLRATQNLKHTTLLFALYGHGLRLNEVLHLRLEDLLWERNQLFVKAGKGKKDRYITMSQEFKHILTNYVHEYNPVYWLFEGQDRKSKYSERSVQEVVKQTAHRAGIKNRVTPHTLRHCYATHLVDTGTQLPYIKELLGHKDIKTTMIYTHITNSSLEKVISPLDLLRQRTSKTNEKPQ